MRRDWKKADGTPVLNRDLWLLLSDAVKGFEIEWVLVPGHAGVPGNEFVDEWAVAASQSLESRQESWELGEFPDAIIFQTRPEARSSSGASSAKPARGANSGTKFSKPLYLSLVDGQLLKHDSWPDCERRVKGTAGARYRKVSDEAELRGVLVAWGLPPDALKV